MLLAGLLIGVAPIGGAGAASTHSRAGVPALRWNVVPSADQGFGGLGSISCLSARDCFATGSRIGSRGFSSTLIESWNGSRFSIVPSPSPSPFDNLLDGISCVSTAFCLAVGSADNKRDFTKTLVEKWNGTRWSVMRSPSPGGLTFIDVLGDVSCASAAFCVAVGGFGPGELTNSLIESWNGTRWSVMVSPSNAPGSDGVLRAVDCLSPTDCMGVGSFLTSGGRQRTLGATWNGSTWTVVPTPNRGPASDVNNFNSLGGVFCLTAKACTAVGQGENKTLIESWNGAQWSIEPSPNRGSAANALGAIACVSNSDCTATGSSVSRPGGSSKTLIESWNGTRWSIMASPNKGPESDFDRLGGVACPSPSFCMTVGSYATINAQGHTLAELGTSG